MADLTVEDVIAALKNGLPDSLIKEYQVGGRRTTRQDIDKLVNALKGLQELESMEAGPRFSVLTMDNRS